MTASIDLEIGDLIEQSVSEIVARWTQRARDEHADARRVHHDVVAARLPEFLHKLGRSLRAAGDVSDRERRQATPHGGQRWDSGWSIAELVRDYQLLRLVLIDYLEVGLRRRLSVRELLVLNVAIDDAVAAAVAACLESQTSPGTSASTTRNEALDLLYNVLGMVGHELRNPLAPLTNSLEILKLARTDPDRIETVYHMMVRQVQVLRRLVEDLLDLPRLARGKMSLVRERLDLAGVVRTCAEDRRAALECAGLQLQVDVPAEPVWTLGDETRLTQALGNLIGNSQKFTDVGGKITVALKVAQARLAVISVRDNGIGIEAAMLPKVFEAYSQADQALDRTRGGLGLGLALVKGVIELHGGSVKVHSEGAGTGATFTIELPLQSADASPPSVRASDGTSAIKRRVLIVEDNLDSAESLKVCLELHGNIVAIAANGEEGLRLAEEFQPEAAICDVGLPGMDGYAVAASLRKTLPKPPRVIIAVSGHGLRKDATGQPDRSFDYYLLKPADPGRIACLLAAERHPVDLELPNS